MQSNPCEIAAFVFYCWVDEDMSEIWAACGYSKSLTFDRFPSLRPVKITPSKSQGRNKYKEISQGETEQQQVAIRTLSLHNYNAAFEDPPPNQRKQNFQRRHVMWN